MSSLRYDPLSTMFTIKFCARTHLMHLFGSTMSSVKICCGPLTICASPLVYISYMWWIGNPPMLTLSFIVMYVCQAWVFGILMMILLFIHHPLWKYQATWFSTMKHYAFSPPSTMSHHRSALLLASPFSQTIPILLTCLALCTLFLHIKIFWSQLLIFCWMSNTNYVSSMSQNT